MLKRLMVGDSLKKQTNSQLREVTGLCLGLGRPILVGSTLSGEIKAQHKSTI